MASTSHISMFFAISRLLLILLLFFIHGTQTHIQSCPKSIHFDCPDHVYNNGETSLDFPFTNSSRPDCGACVLTCYDNGHTMIRCMVLEENTEPDNSFIALDINPSNHTVVAAYPPVAVAVAVDPWQEEKDPCHLVSHWGFSSTSSVSFTIEESESFIRCLYLDGDPIWDSKHYNICNNSDLIVYGPYEQDHLPHPPPPHCLDIKVPKLSSKETNFIIHYNISAECNNCLDHGGQCRSHDDDIYCDYSNERGKHLGIILGTVIPAAILGFLALSIVVCWIKRKKKSDSSTLPSRSLSFSRIRADLEVGTMNGVTIYSYIELEEATNNFDPDKQLGEGGFGVVYYGKLRDGREVAVKRLYEKSYKRIEQFKNEIKILTDLRHQNLVTLYGCTSRHTRELLLVYEYIPNGTVADHLHGEKANSRLLPWPTRLSIAIETATALSYLHFKGIIHRDVKTNNILLDNNFTVKVADFGLSRLFPEDVTHVSTAPQGTPGYVDPEYHQCYHLTNKSDVFSFGVVLIELISSLLAVDVGRERHEINLSNYAMDRIQSSAISELVDPNLGFETDFKVRRMTTLVAELASQCLQHDREVRPSMEEVLETLKNIASGDYEAIEAEEKNRSTEPTHFLKTPPSPADNDNVELLRDTRKPPPSPISVMDKWLSSSKSSNLNTSKST